jgi:hypothetical protein
MITRIIHNYNWQFAMLNIAWSLCMGWSRLESLTIKPQGQSVRLIRGGALHHQEPLQEESKACHHKPESHQSETRTNPRQQSSLSRQVVAESGTFIRPAGTAIYSPPQLAAQTSARCETTGLRKQRPTITSQSRPYPSCPDSTSAKAASRREAKSVP